MVNITQSKIVTASSEAELEVIVQKEVVEQGWEASGPVVKNPDGTFSQRLVK
ncbi:MAG: hypothetical protein ABI792_03175 [bacterium]